MEVTFDVSADTETTHELRYTEGLHTVYGRRLGQVSG
jgi:hypothetical protein